MERTTQFNKLIRNALLLLLPFSATAAPSSVTLEKQVQCLKKEVKALKKEMCDIKSGCQDKKSSKKKCWFELGDALYIKHNYPYFYDVITQLSPKSTADRDICIKGLLCVSGLINLDLQYFDRRGSGFIPGSVIGVGNRPLFADNQPQLIGSINNIDLFLDAALNNWVSAHFDLAYINGSVKARGYVDADVDWNVAYQTSAGLKVNQAYMLLANPAVTPFFFQIGRFNLNFGDYQPFPINETLTQLLSEVRTGGFIVGAILNNGFYASGSWSMAQQTLADFDVAGPVGANNSPFGLSENVARNYAAKVGFRAPVRDVFVNANASWISDIRDANYINGAYAFLNQEIFTDWIWQNFILVNQFFTLERASGVALHADIKINRFALGADYVSALNNLNPESEHSRISAWGVNAGVDFCPCQFPTTLTAGYQGSADADIFLTHVSPPFAGPTTPGVPAPFLPGNILPQTRYLASITTTIMPNISVAVEWLHDKDFGANHGGTGNGSNLVTMRVSGQI